MLILAHRGAPQPGVAENSLAAIADALSAGADGVEVDVRLSADGRLVLWHDRHLPGGDLVRTLTKAGLSAGLGHDVVELSDALDSAPRAYWNIEVKDRAAIDGVCRALADRPGLRALVTSFDHGAASAIASTTGCDAGFLLSHLGDALPVRPPEVGYLVWDFEFCSVAALARAVDAGWRNMAYGPVSVAEMAGYTPGLLAGIITDFPARFAERAPG